MADVQQHKKSSADVEMSRAPPYPLIAELPHEHANASNGEARAPQIT